MAEYSASGYNFTTPGSWMNWGKPGVSNYDGTLNESYALTNPRESASAVLTGMSDEFYDQSNAYSGIRLKQDLEAMTTYNGNKGVLGKLNETSLAQNSANIKNAGDQATRNVSRFGGGLTAEQQGANDLSLEKGRVLGSADTMNRNAMYQRDLNKQLVSGMSGTSQITNPQTVA